MPLPANGTGRDHNPGAFTCFLAGAGVKKGFSYGESDEFGFKAAVDKTSVHDFNSTLLHLMGYAKRDIAPVYGMGLDSDAPDPGTFNARFNARLNRQPVWRRIGQ